MVAASRILTTLVACLMVASLSIFKAQAQESTTATPQEGISSPSRQQYSSGLGGRIANLPGAKTASGIMASSADGLSRYLAPDGPIQPALTAIGGLPLRGAEMANNGISRISQRFDSSAKSLANSAGNDGNIRMPGMDAAESSMPASFSQLGNMMHGAIQQKNKFIMGQAEKGIQAGERLRNMMQGGLQGMSARSSGRMNNAANMMGSAQDAMMKGTEEIKHQVKQSLESKMGRMHSVMQMGGSMRNTAQGVGRTLTEGLANTMEQLQKTGDQVKQQLQGGMQKNMQGMAGIMGSMQGSMGNMGQNMQKNLQGVMRHAQNTAEQVTSHLQQVVSAPLEMVKSLGKMGGMMSGGGSSSGGRY